jgi:hypothetical protein
MPGMTNQQIRNVAVAFLSVVRTQDDVYTAWKALPHIDKYAEFGAFIRDTLYLAAAPTNEEIDNIKALIQNDLKSEVQSLKDVRTDFEVACCMICLSQLT